MVTISFNLLEPVKVTDNKVKEVINKVTSTPVELFKDVTTSKESFRNALSRMKNKPALSNEFIFKNIISNLETSHERRKLTINDFK